VSAARSPRRGHLLRRGGGVALLTAFLALGTATPADAHPYLLRSDPASGAVLRAAPPSIDIDYTEGLDRSYCTVVLISPNGTRITTHQVKADQSTELSVAPNESLTQQGTYAVNWTAVGDDGHTVIGNFGFSIGHPSVNKAVADPSFSDTGGAASAAGLQRLLRTVLPFATCVLAGVLLLASVLFASGRRARRLRLAAFVAQAGLGLALAGAAISDGGLSDFGSSATGERLIATLGFTVLAVPALRDGRVRRTIGWVGAIGLLVVLALSGHASTQPSSRRDLAIAVYSIHLLAVSVWLGALLAVVIRLGTPREQLSGKDPARTLRPLVAGSLLAVLVTGIATTDWGLRTLHDLADTSYGKLAITLSALFLVIVAIGGLASWLTLHRGRRRLGGWLVGVEAVVAAATLVVAGVLGQIAQPLDQPYASRAYAQDTGIPLSVTSAGPDALDVATLAPGVVGKNTLVVEVGDADADDFLSPATDVHSVTATLSCGCGAADQAVTLHPTGDGAEWTSDVTLARPASWFVTALVRRGSQRAQRVELAERVTPAVLPHQVVVGVPASLSGPQGETCRDEVLGLQTALADLNTSAADHGDLMRVVAVDLHDGVGSALDRLQGLRARMIALPCGTDAQVHALTAGARAQGLPVILGAGNNDPTSRGVWSTDPSWQAEGSEIASQAVRQAADSVTAIAGSSPIDREELTGLRSRLARSGVQLHVAAFGTAPRQLAASLQRRDPSLVTLLGDPSEAAPIVHALSDVDQATGWLPPHGILASSQLMSTDFINDAGTITRIGGIEFASDVNPFDPVSQYYAQRLRTLSPGVRPSFNGLRGYEAGLAIAEAMRDGGGDPSPSTITSVIADRFHDFSAGSYELGWGDNGGTSQAVAFFRSTYVNPMAMPVDAPGGASSLAHEGTFLDTGGFEQVAPLRRLK
jgi:methionine-rich copper-binding protein CopC/putative copper export protein/ABC-type branched-subunit amino acid transport system substrate-binding protein